jgi:hypothetical protein
MLSRQVLGQVADRLFVPVHLRSLRRLPALHVAEPAERRPALHCVDEGPREGHLKRRRVWQGQVRVESAALLHSRFPTSTGGSARTRSRPCGALSEHRCRTCVSTTHPQLEAPIRLVERLRLAPPVSAPGDRNVAPVALLLRRPRQRHVGQQQQPAVLAWRLRRHPPLIARPLRIDRRAPTPAAVRRLA